MVAIREARLRAEILEAVRAMYTSVAQSPEIGYHFPVGRSAASVLGYPDALLEGMRGDKKADRAGLKLVLIRSLGEAVVARAPPEDTLRAVLAEQLE